MKTWLSSVKLMIGLAAVLGGLAVAPVAHGGLSWTGIDPAFDANGTAVNVWVEWPSGRECSINGPIVTEVHTSTRLLSESIESFLCESGLVRVQTQTMVKDVGVPYHFNVKRVYVPAQGDFPVQVKIYKNGQLATTCFGKSNADIACSIISTN